MLWIGGGQGAGKTTLSWQLFRANDLPLHRVDLSTYDHLARMPAAASLDEQLARGSEAAADAFESHSRLRLELVLDDVAARAPGKVPVIVEGPQLMPGSRLSFPRAGASGCYPIRHGPASRGRNGWRKRKRSQATRSGRRLIAHDRHDTP